MLVIIHILLTTWILLRIRGAKMHQIEQLASPIRKRQVAVIDTKYLSHSNPAPI